MYNRQFYALEDILLRNTALKTDSFVNFDRGSSGSQEGQAPLMTLCQLNPQVCQNSWVSCCMCSCQSSFLGHFDGAEERNQFKTVTDVVQESLGLHQTILGRQGATYDRQHALTSILSPGSSFSQFLCKCSSNFCFLCSIFYHYSLQNE